MTKYQDNFIGKDQAVDSDTVNIFSQNDQYNYDILSAAPQGIVAWKSMSTNISVAYNSGTLYYPAALNFTFTAKENRFYKFVLRWYSTTRTAGTALIYPYLEAFIDSQSIGQRFWEPMAAGATREGKTFEWISPTGIDAGNHVYSIAGFVSDAATGLLLAGYASSPVQMWVEDMGALVAVS